MKRVVFSIFMVSVMLLSGQTVAFADKKIVYRLKWLINASVAGDIYASSQGVFAQEGLEVEVKPGGPERDAIRELELGYAQFGVASADQVIRAVDKGASIVVVAQLFQVNPLQWIYRADEVSLSAIKDLKGKKVGITYGGNDETIMRALLAKGGFGESDLTLSSVRYDYTPFLRRKVEVWPVYRNTQGIFLGDKLAEAKERVGFFNPNDHGVKFVANSLVTSEKLVKDNPELVNKFVTSLLAGWEAAVAPVNRKKSIDAISEHDADSSRESIGRQLEATAAMVKPSADFVIGKIDTDAWAQTEKIMLKQKLIDKPVNILTRLRQIQ